MIPERRYYRSWQGLLTQAQEPSRFQVSHARESGGHALKFRGTRTWDDALRLATEGYREGAERATALVEPFALRIAREIQRSEIVFDVTGTELDIGRYITQDPEHWMDWSYGEQLDEYEDDYEPEGVRLIRLVVNVGAASDVAAEPIMARGAWVVGLVKLLEHAGHRCEIVSVLASRHEGSDLEIWATIKEAGAQLDANRVAFALAHPSMLRRMYFAVMETLDAPLSDRCEHGYGHPIEVAEANIQESDIYLGKLTATGTGSWTDEDRASAWLLLQLRRAGVKLTTNRQEEASVRT